MKLTFASLLLAKSVNAGYFLAGFNMTSDVRMHEKIDLDLVEIKTKLDAGDKTGALEDYDNGAGNSAKSSGAIRSIGGFWNVGKKTGEFDFSLQKGAGYTESWGDDYATTSIMSDSVPTSATIDALNYIVIKGYVMHELIDAVGDYEAGEVRDNGGGVKAWDEGSFYVGSQVSHLLYSDTNSEIRTLVKEEYEAGAAVLSQTTSDDDNVKELWEHVYKIHQLMNLSTILKLFDHTKVENPTAADVESAKVFGHVIFPELFACNQDDANKLKKNIFDYTSSEGFLVDGYALGVFAPVINNMECLKLDCALVSDSYGVCSGSPYATNPDGTSEMIAGYAPGSNVHPHNLLDVDLLRMERFIAAGDWAGAEKVYTGGWNSVKSSGSKRNLQGFSKGIVLKQEQVPFFNDVYKSYWGGDNEYSDEHIMSLFSGDLDSTPRKELILKSIVSENIFMYTLREFYDAVEDCVSGSITDNDGSVHAWDEGVAFYTGSLIGTQTDSISAAGKSLYTLANKRCGNFGTCDADTGNSNVNRELFELFEKGRDHLTNGECSQAGGLMNDIYKRMLVPNIQGMLRYAWKADPNGLAGGDKEFSEGWAFARAVLPAIQHCTSPENAKIIEDNMDFFGSLGMVSGGHSEVFRAAELAYGCLGLTCDDIGSLTPAGGGCTGECPTTTQCLWTPDDGTDADGAAGVRKVSFVATVVAGAFGVIAMMM